MKARTHFYTLLTVLLLIACDKNGTGLNVGPGSNSGKTGGGVIQQNLQQALPGTTNQDVTTSTEYKQVVADIGTKIAGLGEFSLPDETSVSASSPSRLTDFFERIAKQKKWSAMNFNAAKYGHRIGGGRAQLVPTPVSLNQNQNKNGINNQINQVEQKLPGELYSDKYVKITRDTIYLNSIYYHQQTSPAANPNSQQAADTQQKQTLRRGRLILYALSVQLALNQHDSFVTLLQAMAKADPQVKTEDTMKQAQQEDSQASSGSDSDGDQFDPDSAADNNSSLSSDEVSKANHFYNQLKDNYSKMTADDFFTLVKQDFSRGAAFARPYKYTRDTATTSPAEPSSAPATTADLDSATNDK